MGELEKINSDNEVFGTRHGVNNGHLKFIAAVRSLIAETTLSNFMKQEDTTLILMLGASLGVNPIDALTKISLINGKPVLDAKLQLSILQNMGATVEILKDGVLEPLFITPTGDFIDLEEIVQNRSKYYAENDGTSDADKFLKIKIEKVQNMLNRVTTVKIVYKGKVGIASFSRLEARNAGLLNKDVWKKYEKDMLFNRALTRCIRAYFSYLLHTYLPSELDDNIEEYTLTDEEMEKLTIRNKTFVPDNKEEFSDYIDESPFEENIDSIDENIDSNPLD